MLSRPPRDLDVRPHMTYVAFHTVVNERDVNYRSITITDDMHGIPLGQYGLIQMYCDDVRCDCRRVVFHIEKDGKRHAIVGYGWEKYSFYRKWFGPGARKANIENFMGPALHDGISDYSYSILFVALIKAALSDKLYCNRISQNYKLFRHAIKLLN